MHLTSSDGNRVQSLVAKFETHIQEKNKSLQVVKNNQSSVNCLHKPISIVSSNPLVSTQVASPSIQKLSNPKFLDQAVTANQVAQEKISKRESDLSKAPLSQPVVPNPASSTDIKIKQARGFIEAPPTEEKSDRKEVLDFIKPLQEDLSPPKASSRSSEIKETILPARERSHTFDETNRQSTPSSSTILDKFFSQYEAISKKQKLRYDANSDEYVVKQRSRSTSDALTGHSDKTVRIFDKLLKEIQKFSDQDQIQVNGQSYTVREILGKVVEGSWGKGVLKNNRDLKNVYNQILATTYNHKIPDYTPKIPDDFLEAKQFLEDHREVIASKHRSLFLNQENRMLIHDNIEGREIAILYDPQNNETYLFDQSSKIGEGATRSVWFGINADPNKAELVAVAKGSLSELEDEILDQFKGSQFTIQTKSKIKADQGIENYEFKPDSDYVVFDYCPQNCSDILGEFKTPEQKDHLASQLLAGVMSLHENEIAHNDLKWENMLLNAEGKLKIIDFGEAEIGGKNRISDSISLGQMLYEVYFKPEEAKLSRAVHNEDIIYQYKNKNPKIIRDKINATLKEMEIPVTKKTEQIRDLIVDLMKSQKDGRLNSQQAYARFQEILTG